jgi:molybdenum cofactor cytidylyltransferase
MASLAGGTYLPAAEIIMCTIDAILLAAGPSSRLGRPKQLLPFAGSTLLERGAAALLGARPRRLLVVLGAGAASIRPSLEEAPFDLEVIENRGWRAGVGASIRAGLAALDRHPPPDGVLIGVCDQPLVPAAHFTRLREAFVAAPERVVASVCASAVDLPAIFPRALFTELRVMPAAWGAPTLLARHGARVLRVPCAEAAFDIDTAADYGSLLDGEVVA